MKQPPTERFPISIMLCIIGALIIGLWLSLTFYSGHVELNIGLIVVIGASVLLVLLFIMATGFKALNMADAQQALGLPEGSVRAMMALLLIMTWIIVSVYLFLILPSSATDTVNSRFAQQFYATMSTLVAAIVAFYFGSRTAAAAFNAQAQSTLPIIQKIEPVEGDQGENIPMFTISGKNFHLPTTVKLVNKDNTQIQGTGLLSNDSKILCAIQIDKNSTDGKWDVVMLNDDDSEARLIDAFTVKKVP